MLDKAVRTVTWSADPGTRIGPGEYLDFPLSLGPLPTGVDELVLPAVQTYDDGEVVSWDQPMNADGSEPERPAPSVALGPAAAGGDHHAAMAMPGTPQQPAADGADTAGTSDPTARRLAGAGLLVGALGLGVGAGAVLRSRRRTAPAAAPAPVAAPEREHSGAAR
jgi:hypothetical protein